MQNTTRSAKFVGVTKIEYNRWHARINIKGKVIGLGNYKTNLAACYARHQANITYGVHNV